LLREGTEKQKEKAAKAMSYLAFTRDIKEAISEAGGIPLLVALVRDGTDMQKENAAAALLKLVFYLYKQANRMDLMDKIAAAIGFAGGIPPLVDLVREGTEAQKEYAVQVLKAVTSISDYKFAAINAGAIAPLVALVRNGTEIQKEYAAATLRPLLAFNALPETGINPKLEFLQAGGIPPLLALLRNGTEKPQINAAYVLMSAISYDTMETLLVNLDIIPPLLALLLKKPLFESAYNGNNTPYGDAQNHIWWFLWTAAKGPMISEKSNAQKHVYLPANPNQAAVIAAITAAGGLPPYEGANGNGQRPGFPPFGA